MRRFVQNRWLAFILMLSVLLASGPTVSSPAYGDAPDPLVIDDGSGGSSPSGDPDGTAGPGARIPTGGRTVRPGNRLAAAPVCDGGTSLGVWSWRFHVALRSLISRYYRY